MKPCRDRVSGEVFLSQEVLNTYLTTDSDNLADGELFEDWDANNWNESDEDFDDVLLQNLMESKNNQNDVDDSDQAPIRRPPKIGRNEPCPCGSGKKYKKCCGENG
ncbi:MAG TPA: SEC-C metal-binding domain-containing protein [Bacteroidales bacterium]|nr:SEC-C metal-binding domain-containing protein [Bacteroidales bacterium]